MKVLQINATCGAGSTGKICVAVSNLLTARGVENYILYSHGSSTHPAGIKYGSKSYYKLGALCSRILGNYGFNSRIATKKLISEIKRISPDIIHLHNIHSHNAHLGMLFSYLRKSGIKLYWTFHDCWALTGYCPHFDMVGCDKWKSGCHSCPQRRCYSWFFDRSAELYERKKELFSGLDLTIVTPSQWLADIVKESFLGEYPVKVINNGINLDVFKPTESDFRERYGLRDKKIVLGVAFGWGERKGLDVLVELSKRLGDEYKIVLVGTNDEVDKQLPDNIISIHRTANQRELAEIYTAADVFANPTREENFPTVNMEAIACGTPVVTFRTGGSPEMLDSFTGSVVDKNDVDTMEREIIRMSGASRFKEACVASCSAFEEKNRFEEYIKLYGRT